MAIREGDKKKTTTWSEFRFRNLGNGHGRQLVAEKQIRNEIVYIIIDNDSRTKPKTAGWYCHPLIKGCRLSIIDNIDIFTTHILPMERKIRDIEFSKDNSVMEIISSGIFIPHWVMKKNSISIMFRDKDFCLTWIADDEKRYEIVDILNHYEAGKTSAENTPLKWTVEGDMIKSPRETALDENDVIETVEIPFGVSMINIIASQSGQSEKIEVE